MFSSRREQIEGARTAKAGFTGWARLLALPGSVGWSYKPCNSYLAVAASGALQGCITSYLERLLFAPLWSPARPHATCMCVRVAGPPGRMSVWASQTQVVFPGHLFLGGRTWVHVGVCTACARTCLGDRTTGTAATPQNVTRSHLMMGGTNANSRASSKLRGRVHSAEGCWSSQGDILSAKVRKMIAGV